jgi:hypothetical protein
VNADLRPDLQLVRRDGPTSARQAIPREPMPDVVERSAADVARRLAMWLADVAAEAGRPPAVKAAEPADRTVAL